MTQDPFERAARADLRIKRARSGFLIHLGVFMAVQILLFAIWAATSNGGDVLPWFLFPLGGWGIGVVAHYLGMRSWAASGAYDRVGHPRT